MDEFLAALENLQGFINENRSSGRQDPPAPPAMPQALTDRFGPRTALSIGGKTPDSVSPLVTGELSAYRRPGDYGVEQRVARGVNDAAILAGIPQAGTSIGNALIDPTLANVTDAGFRTGIAAFRPMAALGALGSGYAVAGARDLGVGLGSSSANAADDALDQSARTRLTYLQKKQSRGETLNRAEREEQNSYLATIANAANAANDAKARAELQKKTQEQSEYDRSVTAAESARDKELGRVRRFSDSEFGKIYDKTGGGLAFAGAVGAGALHRAAVGPKPGAMNSLALPALEGTGAALTANSIPLAYNAFLTDPDNPEKAAYQAYSHLLPPTHPRKDAEAQYAASLPDKNPVREAASHEFYNEFWPRLGISAIEGVPSALMGANGPALFGRAMGGVGTKRTAGNNQGGQGGGVEQNGPTGPQVSNSSVMPPPPASQSVRNYPPLGSPEREAIREGYRSTVTGTGTVGSPSSVNRTFQGQFGDLPDLSPRVAATNRAVEAFVAQHGRMPVTRQEWQQFIYRNTGTLAIPAAVGAGAAMSQSPNALYDGINQ